MAHKTLAQRIDELSEMKSDLDALIQLARSDVSNNWSKQKWLEHAALVKELEEAINVKKYTPLMSAN